MKSNGKSRMKIRYERKQYCDEMAIVHFNTRPEHYTGAIVDALVAETSVG